jgi:hypothetical protein
MEQLRDVLELDHVLKNGKIDTKLLELKAKITFALDARKNGGIIQRVEQKQMNLNISTSDKKVAQAALGGTMEDMEKRIRQLEKEERKLLGLKDDSTPERPATWPPSSLKRSGSSFSPVAISRITPSTGGKRRKEKGRFGRSTSTLAFTSTSRPTPRTR